MAETFFLTPARIARLGLLCASGCTMREITEDLEYTDERVLREAMKQLGLRVRAEAAGRRTISVNISAKSHEAARKAAVKRDIVGADKVPRLIERFLDAALGDDEALVDNLLNDLPRGD